MSEQKLGLRPIRPLTGTEGDLELMRQMVKIPSSQTVYR
jgi:hypothetical protein